MNNRKICIVTGSRAEYGLLKLVMAGIKEEPGLDLQVIVTGSHLSPEFGLTYQEIEADGFSIDRQVEMLLSSDSPVGITKSMGLAMVGFADALAELKPDIMMVLGDRFEIFAAVAAAMVARIPIAHVHGGEATEGLIDEAIRHSITKMSQIHFVAAEDYRRRVIQLGESPDRTFLVGGLGVDSIKHLKLLNRSALEKSLNIKLQRRNLLIVFHPVTLEKATAKGQISELLESLSALQDTGLIFSLPNADSDGRIVAQEIEAFVKNNQHAYCFASMGQLRYLSCMSHCDGILGNSSSALLEAPTLGIPAVNIGDRQRGRIKASCIIDCPVERSAISQALSKILSQEFRDSMQDVGNPYGAGGASNRIVDLLKSVNIDNILKKRFFDLPVTCA